MMTLADLFEAIGNEISVTEWSEVKSSVLFEWKKVIEDHISQPQPVAQGEAVDKSMIDSLKSASGYQLRDGTGAMDALFSLAVEAGADRTAAAGFAHHVNGALSELQGLVYSMAGIASSKATIPTGHRVVPVETVGAREAITAAIGFAWGDGELQTVNGDELLRIYALAASPSAGGV